MKENVLKLFDYIIEQSETCELFMEDAFFLLADKMVELDLLYKDYRIEYLYWSRFNVSSFEKIPLEDSKYDDYKVIFPLRTASNKYFVYFLNTIIFIIKRYGFLYDDINKLISSWIVVVERMLPFDTSIFLNKNTKKKNGDKTNFGLLKECIVDSISALAYLTNSNFVGTLYIKYIFKYDFNFLDFKRIMIDSKKERGSVLANIHMYYYCINNGINYSNIEKYIYDDVKETKFFNNVYFDECQKIIKEYVNECEKIDFNKSTEDEYKEQLEALRKYYIDVKRRIVSLEIPDFFAGLDNHELVFFQKLAAQPIEVFEQYSRESRINELKSLVDKIVEVLKQSNLSSYCSMEIYDYSKLEDDKESINKFIKGMLCDLSSLQRIINKETFNNLIEDKAVDYLVSEKSINSKVDLDYQLSLTLAECIAEEYISDIKYAEYNFEQYIDILDFGYEDLRGYTRADNEENGKKYFVDFSDCCYKEIDKRFSQFVIKTKKKYIDIYKDEKLVKDYIFKFFKSANTSLETKHGFLGDLEQEYLSIVGNKPLVEALVSSQVFKEEFEKESDNYLDFGGDYTFLIVGPVKAIERYLKEVLVQKYRNSIHTFDKKGKIIETYLFSPQDVLSAESLSGAQLNIPDKKITLELGPVSKNISYNLCLNPEYDGIFKLKHPYKPMSFDFNWTFIQNVRNGHFHIHMVSNFSEASNLYNDVAYFFRKCIDELGFTIE